MRSDSRSWQIRPGAPTPPPAALPPVRLPMASRRAFRTAIITLVVGVVGTAIAALNVPHVDPLDCLIGLGAVPCYTVLMPLVAFFCILPAHKTVLILDAHGIALERWGRLHGRLAWDDYLGWREERRTVRSSGQMAAGGTTRTLALLSGARGREIRFSVSYPFFLGMSGCTAALKELDRRAPREGSGQVVLMQNVMAGDNPRAGRALLLVGFCLLSVSVWFTWVHPLMEPRGRDDVQRSLVPFWGDTLGALLIGIGLLFRPWKPVD